MGPPKKIWQTWKTYDIPDKWKISPKSIKKHHPNWEYTLTNDLDNRMFVKIHFPKYLNLYDSFSREIYRADMVRYMILYIHGGVYIDLDYKVLKCFDSLFEIDSELYLFKTSHFNSYTNAFMASKPKCKFWLDCLEEIKYRVENPCIWSKISDLDVLYTTGPIMITHVIKNYTQPYVTVPFKLGHPSNVSEHYHKIYSKNKVKYVEELEGSSWTGSVTKAGHFIYSHWTQFFLTLALIVILLIFYFWIYPKWMS